MDDGSALAYWNPPEENPNFVGRPPDPGPFNFYKTLGVDALVHSPIGSAYRLSSMNLEKNQDTPNDNNPGSPAFAPTILDPETANKKYGMRGQLHFDEPITESTAQLLYQRKMDQNDRNYEISSGSTSGFRNVSGFGASMAASMLDPVNLASMFIPVLGEERIGALAKGLSDSPLMQRLAGGAMTGASAQAVLEPLILKANMADQEDYTLIDSAKNLGFGAAFGGLVHAGLGAIMDRVKSMRPAESSQLFETAMNSVLKDEPVVNPGKVEEFIDKKPESAIFSGQTAKNGPWEDHWMVKMPGDTEARSMTALEMRSEGIEIPNRIGEDTRPIAPVEAAGEWDSEMTGGEPLKQYNLTEDIEGHPKGSTVTADTLEKLGFRVPDDTSGAGENTLRSSQPDLSNIPRTDPETGRVYTEEERLQLLQQQVQGDQVQGNRVDKVNQETKENPSRGPKIDEDNATVSPKDTADIEKQTEDLKKQTGLEGDEAKDLDDRIREDVGDQAGREQAVNAAVNCITEHLI